MLASQTPTPSVEGDTTAKSLMLGVQTHPAIASGASKTYVTRNNCGMKREVPLCLEILDRSTTSNVAAAQYSMGSYEDCAPHFPTKIRGGMKGEVAEGFLTAPFIAPIWQCFAHCHRQVCILLGEEVS